MKSAKTKEPETSEEYQWFEKFAKALMAVPKEELDRTRKRATKETYKATPSKLTGPPQ